MNNKIEIPREVFENIFFANGGTKKEVVKELAGNYQAPLTKDKLHLANAEVEKNEYVFDSKGIRKFGGNTHEKGGTPVKLEEGSKILSDHLKIGADLAKELTKSLKLPFRATDTYAKALDRFNKSSDLPKLNKEIENLILKMDSEKSKDKTTFELNNQFLNNTINSKNKQKQPLEKEMASFFDMLFQEQEKSKKGDSGYKMQLGGSYMELATKHGISPERAKELLKNLPHYQDSKPQYPNNPFISILENTSVIPQGRGETDGMSHTDYWNNQTKGRVLGEVSREARKYTDEEKNIIKKSYSEIVKDKKSLDELYKAVDSDSLVYNPGMLKALKEGKKMPLQLQHKDAQGTYGQQDEDKLNGYLYRDALGKDFKPGDPEFTKELYSVVTKDLKEKGINWDGSPYRNQITAGIGNVNQRQPGFVMSGEAKKSGSIDLDAFRKQSPGGKQMIADEYGIPVDRIEEAAKNITNKFLKLTGEDAAATFPQGTPQSTSEDTPTISGEESLISDSEKGTKLVNSEEEKRRRGLLSLPDQIPMLPILQASLKALRRFNRIGYNDISPEQQLAEMNRSSLAARQSLEGLTPQQKAAAEIGLVANENMMSNKVIADVNRANSAARNAVDVYNARVSDAEENASAQDALDYERRTHTTLGNYDKEIQGYYDKLASNQMNNWKTVAALNRYNAMNPDVQFTGEGYEVNRNPGLSESVKQYLDSLYQEDSKKKTATAKFGGRFKK